MKVFYFYWKAVRHISKTEMSSLERRISVRQGSKSCVNRTDMYHKARTLRNPAPGKVSICWLSSPGVVYSFFGFDFLTAKPLVIHYLWVLCMYFSMGGKLLNPGLSRQELEHQAGPVVGRCWNLGTPSHTDSRLASGSLTDLFNELILHIHHQVKKPQGTPSCFRPSSSSGHFVSTSTMSSRDARMNWYLLTIILADIVHHEDCIDYRNPVAWIICQSHSFKLQFVFAQITVETVLCFPY